MTNSGRQLEKHPSRFEFTESEGGLGTGTYRSRPRTHISDRGTHDLKGETFVELQVVEDNTLEQGIVREQTNSFEGPQGFSEDMDKTDRDAVAPAMENLVAKNVIDNDHDNEGADEENNAMVISNAEQAGLVQDDPSIGTCIELSYKEEGDDGVHDGVN